MKHHKKETPHSTHAHINQCMINRQPHSGANRCKGAEQEICRPGKSIIESKELRRLCASPVHVSLETDDHSPVLPIVSELTAKRTKRGLELGASTASAVGIQKFAISHASAAINAGVEAGPT